MKKTLLFILLTCVTLTTNAYAPYFDIKAKMVGGGIIKHSNHLENTVKNPVWGAELSIEFLPQGKYTWESYYKFPIIGLGILGLDLGNPKIFGQAFAAYPYALIPFVRKEHFNFHFKIGMGIAVLTKTWEHCATDEGVNSPNANAAIGSHVNAFLPIGLNFDFPIAKGWTITSDLMFNHISNGSVIQPNAGLNMINGYVGVAYRPNWREYMMPWRDYVKPAPRTWDLELSAAGGYRELYYKDERGYGIASFRATAYRQLTNVYRIGFGADVFYDGVFVKQGNLLGHLETDYKRYEIENNNFSYKWRAGISIANEFVMGRITAGLHWGFYLYDPIKDAYPKGTNPKYADKVTGVEKRPWPFYTYNPEKEDGWNYFRLMIKYRIVDNLFASVAIKTHLQKAEFIEWGLGYTFKFKAKKSRTDMLYPLF